MTNAIAQIADMAVPLMKEESVAQFMASINKEPNFRDRAAIFNPANSKPFEALLNWDDFPEPNREMNVRPVYEQTLDYVGGVHQALKEKESPRIIFRRILCFGPMLPAQFISFVEQQRPRALAILAHLCAMAKAVDDHWVFHGLAEREVLGIQRLLPQEWQWAMKWPLQMLRQEPGNVP
jgi:hypothetical protein